MGDRSQRVGDYIVRGLIGAGSTGKVRIGEHKDTGQQYALKIITKSQFDSKPALQAKIRREIAVMRILDHPNLIKFVEALESGRHIYLVMELASHGELFDYLTEHHALHYSAALPFFRGIIAGLEYLHSRAICHRDLKPENILLSSFDQVKIADFGFSRWMKTPIVETSCGSPHYAAPEVIQGLPYDGRSADIWSCGVILYALLVGRLPFDDPSVRKVLAKVRSGKFNMPDLPEPLVHLISQMLCVDPAKRITMAELKAHRAFLMDIPSISYDIWEPLPLPSVVGPIDPESVDPAIFTILKSIGYASDEAILQEFIAVGDTSAKTFFHLLTKQNSYEAFPWQDEIHVQTSSEYFRFSPVLISGAERDPLIDWDDTFKRRRKTLPLDMDQSSAGTPSVLRHLEWGASEFESPLVTEQTFTGITTGLEKLMAALQFMINQNKGYRYFHPTPVSIIAGNSSVSFYMGVEAARISETEWALTVKKLRGSDATFSMWCSLIGSAVESGFEET